MRLFAFEVEGTPRWGAEQNGSLVDVPAAYQALLALKGVFPGLPSGLPPGLPRDLMSVLRLGAAAAQATRETLSFMARRPATPVGERLTYAFEEVRLLAPLARPGKILLAGAGAAAEAGRAPGTSVWSPQFGSAVIGPGQAIVQPFPAAQLFSELHLAMVIGRRLKQVSAKDSLQSVVAYTLLNAISMRPDPRASHPLSGWRACTCDTFAPMGPGLVTPEELPAPWQRAFSCRINGELRQQGKLGDGEKLVGSLLAELTLTLALHPGDVVGVSVSRWLDQPATPWALQPGDTVAWEVEGWGTLSNPVIERDAVPAPGPAAGPGA